MSRAHMPSPSEFEPLLAFLERLPAISLPAGRRSIGSSAPDEASWLVELSLDDAHRVAWRVVQELGHALNYLSLPTDFKPVSPPPYMNGGVEFLSWVIETTSPDFSPGQCAEWLEGRLPRPVED